MARVKLTAGRINSFQLPPGKKQAFLWDTDAPGLAVRSTPEIKAFVWQGRVGSRSVRVTIGNVLAWDIESGDPGNPGAREEARRMQSLANQGIDPRDDKAEKIAATEAKREQARRQEITVGEAWDQYIEARRGRWGEHHLHDHLKLARAGGEPDPRHRKEKRLTNAGPLAELMPLRLVDLTPDTLQSWMEKETAARPSAARLAFRLLRAFLRWCSEKGFAVDPGAIFTKEVRESVPAPQAKADCLQREQLQPWFDAVQQIQNPVISAYLQALLLTGARREELMALTWESVDPQWRSLTIKDKVKGKRIIPLTPYVAALITSLPHRSQWVFSSLTSASGRLREPTIAHTRAVKIAGLPSLTLHGLRRSFGTLSEWCELPTGVVAQIMGHKPSALAEKHYRPRPLDLLRQWHTKLEGWMLEQAGIDFQEQAPGLRVVVGG
jgi:integrase